MFDDHCSERESPRPILRDLQFLSAVGRRVRKQFPNALTEPVQSSRFGIRPYSAIPFETAIVFLEGAPRNFGGRLLPWQRGGGIDWLQWWKEEQGNPGIAGKDLQIIYDPCCDINLILMRMRVFRSVCNLLDRLCIIFAGS
ncbi:hypothetical protein [Azotobacter salinestris]|uniref:hypothetical protein n=1 Tax=Azotobacter salinestris TaxID=69964 RepID=UPI0032DF8D61